MFNGYKVLDVHSHVSVPPGSRALLASLLASNSPLKSPLSEGGRDQATPEEYRKSVDTHIAYMDDRDIDVQIIGPRPFIMMGQMPQHLLPGWTRYVNDTIKQQVDFYPDRFLGAAQLPQLSSAEDLTHCLPELERCVNELGFVAAYVSPDPAGVRSTPGMHEAYWYPLYQKCEEMQIPIIVHGTTCLDPRFGVVPQNYQLGFVIEQYLATQFLSHGDVFERFPNLKVVVCHCGGALDRFIPSDPHLAQKDLSNNLFFDTCAHDVNYLTAAVKQRGVERLVFGTEAPGSGAAVRHEGEGPGKTGDDLVPVISSFDFLTPDDLKKIFNTNPAKVFPQLGRV
jgi:predicted TIM-barrel fold metal-dependent hydrolase